MNDPSRRYAAPFPNTKQNFVCAQFFHVVFGEGWGGVNHNAALSDGTGGALWLLYLLEEGCHSAGFVTTIHVRHHLLLS